MFSVAGQFALSDAEQDAAPPNTSENNFNDDDFDSHTDRSDGSSASVDDVELPSSSRKHFGLSTPMTLKITPLSPKKASANVAVEATSNNSFNEWGDWNVDSFNEEVNHSSKSAEPPGRVETHARSKVTSNQPLGAEYDIMQLKVKAASPCKTVEEFDFFADMAPDIKPSKSGTLLEVIGNQTSTSAARFIVTAGDESGVIIVLLMFVVLYIFSLAFNCYKNYRVYVIR